VVVKDGNEILPADRIFVYKKEKSYAGFANLFRYKLLLDHGNIWVDTDVICLRPYRFDREFIIGRVLNLDPAKKGEWVNGSGVIGARPGSEFVRRCFEYADKQDPESLVWGQTGPQLTTRIVQEMGLHNETLPEHYLGCIRASKWYRSIHPKPHYSIALWYLFRLRGAYSLHLYNELWRKWRKDKNATYPRHTIYERLKRKYDVSSERVQM
ncbi:MAG: glycosyltransferase, partial [Verrucomicrobia bacterium]|nr:glycosyltransferase [Verrucomicrobiota bacterium]